MTLTQHDKQLVRETFALLAPQAQEATEAFYDYLAHLEPEAYRLQKSIDRNRRGQQFMMVLSIVVQTLDDLEIALYPFQQLQRHYRPGMNDYQVIGMAFLWMLQETLGDAYTPEVAGAWRKTYTQIVELAAATSIQNNFYGGTSHESEH